MAVSKMEDGGKDLVSEDDKIDLAKELIAKASLILKSKGKGYDKLSWLLEDTLSEIENLQLPSRDNAISPNSSMESLMEYLDEVSDPRSDSDTDAKEITQNN